MIDSHHSVYHHLLWGPHLRARKPPDQTLTIRRRLQAVAGVPTFFSNGKKCGTRKGFIGAAVDQLNSELSFVGFIWGSGVHMRSSIHLIEISRLSLKQLLGRNICSVLLFATRQYGLR